ncbi:MULTISPECIES: hypothetical protein [Actinotignum]|uniref:hypothetical protein n=1 Tax=Actinotignum TaxID=1653174 RepID=UPI002550A63C|nr:hypothetical protein [Actinotignum schaalii]MDE1536995.1 hypothetical protein [Actinotignum schaalii]MDK7272360.1 hypothetical protein [Actinotignum schaalii]MDY5145382.1 hypothetical protein [Actinotignum timonense]
MGVSSVDETRERAAELAGDYVTVAAQEAIEDVVDVVEAESAWADIESGKERLIPFDEVVRSLELED